MFSRLSLIVLIAAAIIAAAPSGSRAQDDLPPEVQFDVLRLQLANAVRDGRHKDVLTLTAQMRKLGQPMPPEAVLHEARAFHAVGALPNAKDALTSYLKAVGRDGAHYDEAIRLYVSIKETLDAKARKADAREALRGAWRAAHEAWQSERDAAASWKKNAVVFGGPGEDSGVSLAHGPDGSLVVAGAFHLAKDKDGNNVDVTLPWITAFNAQGRRIWHRPLGSGQDSGNLRSVTAVPGRGFLFGGMQKGFQIAAMTDWSGNVLSNGEGDPWIIGFAPAPQGEGGIARPLPGGDVLALGAEEVGKAGDVAAVAARLPVAVWLRPDGTVRRKIVLGRKGGRLWFDVQDALVLDDGGAVLAGETRRDAGDMSSTEGYLLRIGPEGQELWLQRFAPGKGGTMSLTALSLVSGSDGASAIMAAGRDGKYGAWLAVDMDGRLLWRRRDGGGSGISGSEFLCEADNLRTALTEAFAGRSDDPAALAARRDAGAVLGFACGRGRPFAAATEIVRRDADDFLVLGVAGYEGEPATRITLSAVNGAGEVRWQRRHGDAGASLATAGVATSDGGVAVVGVATNWARDVAAFKVSRDGTLEKFTALAPPAGVKALPEAEPVPEDGSKDWEASGNADEPAGNEGAGGAAEPSAALDDAKGAPAADAVDSGTAGRNDAAAPGDATGEGTGEGPDLLELLGDVFGRAPGDGGDSGKGAGSGPGPRSHR